MVMLSLYHATNKSPVGIISLKRSSPSQGTTFYIFAHTYTAYLDEEYVLREDDPCEPSYSGRRVGKDWISIMEEEKSDDEELSSEEGMGNLLGDGDCMAGHGTMGT